MAKVFLSIGSNLGDREGNISKAIFFLNQHAHIRVLEVSSIIETKPYGYVNQPDFLNGAILIETDMSPSVLLVQLQQIEHKLKRKRGIKWGPRTIDLDILFYDGLIIDQEGLKIPHAELHKRFFVLKPLSELAGDFIHPILQESVARLLEKLE